VLALWTSHTYPTLILSTSAVTLVHDTDLHSLGSFMTVYTGDLASQNHVSNGFGGLDQLSDQVTPFSLPTLSAARSLNAAGERSKSNSEQPGHSSTTVTVVCLP
jgi:hypothetical protein